MSHFLLLQFRRKLLHLLLVTALLCIFAFPLHVHAQETENNATRTETQLSLAEKQALVHLSLGDSFLKNHRLDNAFKQYKDFVEMYPYSPMRFYALNKMAKIEEERQNFFQALLLYKQLQEENVLNEKGVEYLFEMARLYETIGEYEEAKKIYHQLINSYPDSFYAQNAQNRLALADMLAP